MNNIRRLTTWSALIILLGVFSASSVAEDRFIEEIHNRYPSTHEAIIKKAFRDFYSLTTSGGTVFMRDDFSVIITGDVIDLRTNKSLLAELNTVKIDLADFNSADAIVSGSGNKRLIVFSDPDCPFCKMLEASLAKLNNVEVWTFPFPIAELHPNAPQIVENIWCGQDKAALWHNYVLDGQMPARMKCATPIERNRKLAEKYRISGTPTIIFPDGTLSPGALAVEQIEARLNSMGTN